ncbi:MAG: class I SAM-dependent methyltransferase [Microcystis aeruginosa Ma_QC_C_20070703_M131]|uniref:Class I SAM-dependent methyltransferase n=1 Tax=Microcystis aeruginosa Ma_QC_C_20070703_M131 TaxID=2486263 RepID=A0A551Y5G5_MICAE|nr:MAG: class I SAM-dependent methyltransferase [Microcystis aeruginosa Ma_QC_C_20070703_M131]
MVTNNFKPMKSRIKHRLINTLGEENYKLLWKLFCRFAYFTEYVVGGGKLREKTLVKLLEQHYSSKFRRQWLWSEEQPHFEDQQIFFFNLGFSEPDKCVGIYPFYRGFLSSEAIFDGDIILDIGCGDGFFTSRFLSNKKVDIDAVDIEASSIQKARQYNPKANINYQILDAINQPFPHAKYEVIVWDGAIGHFPTETTNRMLEKISSSLKTEGIFIGSESLGLEGHDHLQFFGSLNDLYLLFKPYFKYIQLRQIDYPLKWCGNLVRQEAFWRCSNDLQRLQKLDWQNFSSEDAKINH